MLITSSHKYFNVWFKIWAYIIIENLLKYITPKNNYHSTYWDWLSRLQYQRNCTPWYLYPSFQPSKNFSPGEYIRGYNTKTSIFHYNPTYPLLDHIISIYGRICHLLLQKHFHLHNIWYYDTTLTSLIFIILV